MESIIDNMTNYFITRDFISKDGGFIIVELKKTDTTPSSFSFLLGQDKRSTSSIMNVNSNIKNDNIKIEKTFYIPEKRRDYFENMKVNLVTISGLDKLQTDDIFSGKSDLDVLFSSDFPQDTFKLYTNYEKPKFNKKIIIGVFIVFLLIILGFLYKKYKN